MNDTEQWKKENMNTKIQRKHTHTQVEMYTKPILLFIQINALIFQKKGSINATERQTELRRYAGPMNMFWHVEKMRADRATTSTTKITKQIIE